MTSMARKRFLISLTVPPVIAAVELQQAFLIVTESQSSESIQAERDYIADFRVQGRRPGDLAGVALRTSASEVRCERYKALR
jgi:hypothetical protein